MRHISGLPVFIFTLLLALGLLPGIILAIYLQNITSNLLSACFVFLVCYSGIIIMYRTWLWLRPIPTGSIEIDSRDELNYMVLTIFSLLFIEPISTSSLIPVPLTRLYYKMLGAKIGSRTYSGGVLYDPHFIELGYDSLIGARALLIPHFLQGKRLEFHRIQIGNNVTVGAMSIVLAGCQIQDGAIIGSMSLLPKGTKVGANEVWAGNPAKFIRMRSEADL